MTEYSNVSGGWHRIVGQTAQVLRGRWTYGVIALLAERAKEPRELHAELADVHRRLHWLCGDRPIASDALYTPLQEMVHQGLLEHVKRSGFPQISHYQLTDVSEALLGSLDQLAPWCEENYSYLERMTRIKCDVDPGTPIEDVPAVDKRTQIARQRRGVGMAFGLFSPRWSWGLLSVISEGPRSPRDLFAVHAARIAKNLDTVGDRTMSEKVGYDVLHWLSRCELISKRAARKDEAGRVVYELTPFGRSLMDAFQLVGETMAQYESELILALREQRRLNAAGHLRELPGHPRRGGPRPRPSTVLTG